MKQSHFFAHLSRLKLINRWPLMRNVRTENVSEHSLQVAMVAHALAAIKNRKLAVMSTPNVSLYWRCTTMPQKCSPAISLLR